MLNTYYHQRGQPQRDCPYGTPILRLNPFILACCPLRKFQVCDRGRAFKIWDCLSEASFPNLARPTKQTGPEGERFVGAPFFWVLFLRRTRKVAGGRGRAPFRTVCNTLPRPAGLMKDQFIKCGVRCQFESSLE